MLATDPLQVIVYARDVALSSSSSSNWPVSDGGNATVALQSVAAASIASVSCPSDSITDLIHKHRDISCPSFDHSHSPSLVGRTGAHFLKLPWNGSAAFSPTPLSVPHSTFYPPFHFTSNLLQVFSSLSKGSFLESIQLQWNVWMSGHAVRYPSGSRTQGRACGREITSNVHVGLFEDKTAHHSWPLHFKTGAVGSRYPLDFWHWAVSWIKQLIWLVGQVNGGSRSLFKTFSNTFSLTFIVSKARVPPQT